MNAWSRALLMVVTVLAWTVAAVADGSATVPASVPATTPAATTAPVLAASRVPAPAGTALQEARKLVDGIFADDLAKAKKHKEKIDLARKLLESASETRYALAERYVLLSMAVECASEGGDAETAFLTIDALDAAYQVDAIGLRLRADGNAQQNGRGQSSPSG